MLVTLQRNTCAQFVGDVVDELVLASGLVGGLVTPGDIEQAFVALALTLCLQLFGDFCELFSVWCADESQHFRLQLHEVQILLCHAVSDVTSEMEAYHAARNIVHKYEAILSDPFIAMSFY